MLEANPDTIGHSFVISNDEGIVLAGIDGRYALHALLVAAWPEWPSGATGDDPCDLVGAFPLSANRTLASVALEDGSSIEVYDGSANDLAAYRLLIEIATTNRANERFGEEVDVQVARWLLGQPR